MVSLMGRKWVPVIYKGKMGVTISHWQGVFTTSDGQELLFKGRDMSKITNLLYFELILLIQIN